MPNLHYELHHKICNLRYGTPVSRFLQPQLIAEAPEAEQLVLVQASPDVRNDVWLEDASLDVDA